jgi:hypothetical protein
MSETARCHETFRSNGSALRLAAAGMELQRSRRALVRFRIQELMRRFRRRHWAMSATEQVLGGAAKRAPAAPVGREAADRIVGPGPTALRKEGIGVAGPLSAGLCQALLERMVTAIAPKRARAPWIAILGRAVILRMSRRSERERNRNECKPHDGFLLGSCPAGSIGRRRYLFPGHQTNPVAGARESFQASPIRHSGINAPA